MQETKTAARLKINCPTCAGTGKTTMGDELHETLVAVRSMRSATSMQLLEQLQRQDRTHIGLTACNNRLEELRTLGLLQRHKQGRCWVYTPTKQS